MKTEIISAELQKFNVTDLAINEMATQYMPLKVTDLNDKEQVKVVHDARMTVKSKRVEVEKTRKELNNDAQSFIKAVNGEAKRITALLEPIEEHLQSEEDKVEAEKEKIRVAEETRIQNILNQRITVLIGYGALFNGIFYTAYGMKIDLPGLREMPDSDFLNFSGKMYEFWAEEQKAVAERERIRLEKETEIKEQATAQAMAQAEINRQKELLEKEMERIKAEKFAIAEEQRRINASLEAERQAIEAQKLQAELDKQRAAEVEAQKLKVVEQTKKEIEERLKKEAEAKKLAERKAEEERIQAELLAPDKEKLQKFVSSLVGIPAPALKSKKALSLLSKFEGELIELIKNMNLEISRLK